MINDESGRVRAEADAAPSAGPLPNEQRVSEASLLRYSLLPLLICELVVLWLAFSLNPRVEHGHDFIQNGWLPAKLILEGQNPYQPDQVVVHRLADPYMLPIAAGDTEFNSGPEYNAIYPYWVLLLQVPLGLLEFPAALIVWTIVSGTLLLAGLYLSLAAARRMLGITFAPPGWAGLVLLLGLVALFFAPTLLHIYLGQHSIIIFFLLALLFVGLNSRSLAIPVLIAITTMKPQLTALIIVAALLGWLLAQQWRKVAATLGSVALLYLAPLLFAPYSFSDWFSISFLAQKQSTRLAPASSSWWGLAYHWGARFIGSWWWLIALLLSALTLLLLIRPLRQAWAARDVRPVLPLMLIITLLVTPYTIAYDQVLLLLPFAWLWLRLPVARSWGRIMQLCLLVWITLLPLLLAVLAVDVVQSNYIKVFQSLALLGLYYLITAATDVRGERILEDAQP
jgi:Glycosyltransferase family 87